ncbi:myb proto-oncogene protein [Senna tora]|uniref:Myb proto-oncogene protein n=1 Tax=Senna tora TaxID=362788 RepID=A0A834X9C2_9FABA|nr:myb proto-oncogene protein [Senna tora]
MAMPYPSCLVSSSARFLPSTDKNYARVEPPYSLGFKGTSWFVQKHSCNLSVKKFCAKLGPKVSCSMNMSAQESDDHNKIKLDHLIAEGQKLWDSSPQPVKSFPWNKALENFIQLILDLFLAVVKYLSVPVLAISSLSELSYCAHEKKLFLVPVPLLFGFTIAGVLKEAALDSSPRLKDAEVPWHLIVIAILFTLIKLPGPYYPYWGRILIPHFTNGVLLRTLWFAILWYRRPQKPSKLSNFVDGSE